MFYGSFKQLPRQHPKSISNACPFCNRDKRFIEPATGRVLKSDVQYKKILYGVESGVSDACLLSPFIYTSRHTCRYEKRPLLQKNSSNETNSLTQPQITKSYKTILIDEQLILLTISTNHLPMAIYNYIHNYI